MGEIRTKVKLENNNDLALNEAGYLNKNKIRNAVINALVDTGAVEILLPQDLVEKLGLKIFDKMVVTLANDQKVNMNLAGPLQLTICGRKMITDCLVGPLLCEPLIGQIVMERLDLIPDPRKRILTPRPESPYLPTLKLKCIKI